MDLNLIPFDDKILRKVAESVTDFTDIPKLSQSMRKFMEDWGGVGLAAPQVGISKQIFVSSQSAKAVNARVYVNPKLINGWGEDTQIEGCLSLMGTNLPIKRYTTIEIEAADENGNRFSETLNGIPARIFQHEYDHLMGILITH